MPPHQLASRTALALLASTLAATAVWATVRKDYLWVTNRDDTGGTGMRYEFSTDASGYPCLTSATAQDFSPGDRGVSPGMSYGMARNYLFNDVEDYIWVSIRSPRLYGGCNASAGNYCIGAARIDISDIATGTDFTRTWDPDLSTFTVDHHAVDVIGFDTDVTVLSKHASGSIEQFDTADATINDGYGSASHATQIEWLDGQYYAATIANTQLGGANCSAVTTDGQVWIGHLDPVSATPDLAVVVGGAGSKSKPEAIEAFPIDPASPGSCGTADKVVYVGDYCNSKLYIYTWSAATPTSLTAKGSLSLNQDSAGRDSTLLATYGECRPAMVRYFGQTNKLLVTCQDRGSILRLNASDRCAPTWVNDTDEAPLITKDPSIDLTVEPNPSCGGPYPATVLECGGRCQPHDIAFDKNIHSGWAFIALKDTHEITAVQVSNLSNQRLQYRGGASFDPNELEMAPSCNPSSPTCTYPEP